MIPDVLRTSFEPSHPASPGEGEGITAQVASGPQTQLAGTSRHGSSGLRAMRVRWDGPGERRIVIVDTPVRVPADGRLSYDLFLDAVFVQGLTQITLARSAQWGNEKPAAERLQEVAA